jgi:hypothetical protein
MSLDVTLRTKETQLKKVGSGIFVRENGQTKEITQEEWDLKHPGVEPFSFNPPTEETIEETNEVFEANITHNLNIMAGKAGIYLHLWRPDEINITKAKELIEPLRQGLHELKLDPEVYKELNPENGWGTYEQLVKFVEDYLNACYQYPDADVEVDR